MSSDYLIFDHFTINHFNRSFLINEEINYLVDCLVDYLDDYLDDY